MKNLDTSGVSFEECLRKIFSGERACRHDPGEPVAIAEVPLGTLENPVARALFSLLREMDNNWRNYSHSVVGRTLEEEERKEVDAHLQQMRGRSLCVNCLLREFIQTEFPATRDETVQLALRKDWQVVMFKYAPAQPGGLPGNIFVMI
ncbi:MAG: hypothetical protein QOG91_185 [Candidatus Parcubacteria bacterium]|jgi:hypothetical protein|nr:hypothetical protein [Candidatus Parcubacteria bacterium]